MNTDLTRRCFLKQTAAGLFATSALVSLTQRLCASSAYAFPPVHSKVRVGKIYLGREHPGWPTSQVNVAAEAQKFERELVKLGARMSDVELVDGGVVEKPEQLAAAKAKLAGVDGILVVQISMGIGGDLKNLMELNLPIVVFALPYTGHEWHTIASWQRQGKLIEVFPTSKHEDVLEAVRPFRALHNLREARILHVSTSPADPAYCQAIKQKFGTEIISTGIAELEAACAAADRSEAMADCRRWMKDARKIVEPTKEEILKSSVMFVAMRDLMGKHQAEAITMNCLGMNLIGRGLGYPCLGFVRFNNMGLGGVCEADLKSTMTHLIFSHLVGKPGFVTDPVFDLSNGTIIHAHCVAATQMEGPGSPAAPFHIRSHLEDGKGVSLMVKLPVQKKLSMARLFGNDLILFSTGEAVDSPFVEHGCRTKLTMKVQNAEKFLENWSSGLHRVVFYGDHSRDIARYCRFAGIRLVREGVDDLKDVQGLEWGTHVHA